MSKVKRAAALVGAVLGTAAGPASPLSEYDNIVGHAVTGVPAEYAVIDADSPYAPKSKEQILGEINRTYGNRLTAKISTPQKAGELAKGITDIIDANVEAGAARTRREEIGGLNSAARIDQAQEPPPKQAVSAKHGTSIPASSVSPERILNELLLLSNKTDRLIQRLGMESGRVNNSLEKGEHYFDDQGGKLMTINLYRAMRGIQSAGFELDMLKEAMRDYAGVLTK